MDIGVPLLDLDDLEAAQVLTQQSNPWFCA